MEEDKSAVKLDSTLELTWHFSSRLSDQPRSTLLQKNIPQIFCHQISINKKHTLESLLREALCF